MLSSFLKSLNVMAGPCSPKHGSALLTVLNNPFILTIDVKQLFKISQFYGWAVHPNIPYHGSARFTVLNIPFILIVDVNQPFKNS